VITQPTPTASSGPPLYQTNTHNTLPLPLLLLPPPPLLLLLLLLQNNWTAAITQPTPHGFLWTPSPAPAHSVAAVSMLGLAFAAAEQHTGRSSLVRNMECWCLQQVRVSAVHSCKKR
jgi:hypothetical protein